MKYQEAYIEESESGIFRVFARNKGENWVGIGSTPSKSEAIDMAYDWATKLANWK